MPAACLFPDELVSAYGNAKVILTETSPDAWVKSMDKSYYGIIDHSSWGILQKIDHVRNVYSYAFTKWRFLHYLRD